MAKKKIMKDDGVTEDFDAEALAPDEVEGTEAKPETAEAKPEGDMSELLAPKAEDGTEGKSDEAAKADEAAPQPSTTPGAPEAVSEDKGLAEGAEGAEGAQAPAQEPALAEPHPEAQAAVDVAPELMDTFKEVGNLLTPALKKLNAEFEEKIAELEDEAKNRFAHMRQKATECLAALETIFKRD